MNKLNIILDIDETLVYFIKKGYFSHSWDKLSVEEKTKYSVVEHPHGIFIKRPHLDTFFDYLFENYNVSIWTWSDNDYAHGVVNTFIKMDHPERLLKHVLSDKHASKAANIYGQSKDLRFFWEALNEEEDAPVFAPSNTILIDDLPGNSVNTANRDNSITIKPFALFGEVKDRSDPYEDVSNDDSLLKVIELLKKTAAHIPTNSKAHVFGKRNIIDAGLENYVGTIKSKKGELVDAIVIGEISMHGGGRRRHTRKSQRHRKVGLKVRHKNKSRKNV